jgi:Domain of unknown function (DUF3332)
MKRTHRVRSAIALAVSALFLTSAAGCYGRFRAMNGVYDFNRAASDNTLVRSLLMWGMIVIPVYPVAFLVDALVLNVLDFFNGTNKVAQTQTLPDGSEIQTARLDADTVQVKHVDKAGKVSSFDVVRVGPNAGYLRDSDGRIVGSVERLPDGRLVQTAH